MAAGNRAAPICTDCHSEHKIEALKGDSSLKISDVCSRCHASVTLDSKYNLPADRVKTYVESYHGLAAQYGSTVVANCASCHGYHKVLPSSDPDSMINPKNLVATCGQCHPGANRMFVRGKIHVDLTATPGRGLGGQDQLVGAPDLSHADLRRRGRDAVPQCAVVFEENGGALSSGRADGFAHEPFAALAARCPRRQFHHPGRHRVCAEISRFLAGTLLGSNESLRRWTHRIAGIVLLLAGVYHLVYLLRTPEGRRLLQDLFPIKKDLADLWCALRYLVGWSREKPKIGRFGYAEKLEYWAVVWGTIIMGVTGLMIWFKMDVTAFLPRWVVDVAMTIHYYEAVLACLAIVVWHFYHVIFDPDVYPLNPACWDGRVSEEWQQHEHPLEQQTHWPAPAASNPARPNLWKSPRVRLPPLLPTHPTLKNSTSGLPKEAIQPS